MVTATAERVDTRQFDEIIRQNYGETALYLGHTVADVVDAFAIGRQETSVETLEVNGIKYKSYRIQLGILDESDRSRGGIELSHTVSYEKVWGKSVGMLRKHMLGETGNVAGKSGILASEEELRYLNDRNNPDSRRDRDQLFALHALAHDFNPRTNVGATDINTYTPDMDAAAAAIEPIWGTKAGAAFSGASEKYGGRPELQAPRTGEGACIALDEYFKDLADKGDARVLEAINGGKPLTVLVQGLGKAGWHFVKNLPPYIRVKGAMERNGAIVARGGMDSFLELTNEQLLKLSEATQLGSESIQGLNNTDWLSPDQLQEFWKSGAHVIAPCYDRDQFNEKDAANFEGIVCIAVANGPFTKGAKKVIDQNGKDLLTEEIANTGGTLSSQGLWERIMYPETWTKEGYDAKWRRGMQGLVRAALSRTTEMRHEQGIHVPISKASELIVVQRAIARVQCTRVSARA